MVQSWCTRVCLEGGFGGRGFGGHASLAVRCRANVRGATGRVGTHQRPIPPRRCCHHNRATATEFSHQVTAGKPVPKPCQGRVTVVVGFTEFPLFTRERVVHTLGRSSPRPRRAPATKSRSLPRRTLPRRIAAFDRRRNRCAGAAARSAASARCSSSRIHTPRGPTSRVAATCHLSVHYCRHWARSKSHRTVVDRSRRRPSRSR